jgi:hypothetical protein
MSYEIVAAHAPLQPWPVVAKTGADILGSCAILESAVNTRSHLRNPMVVPRGRHHTARMTPELTAG